jgi:hypothetical protein
MTTTDKTTVARTIKTQIGFWALAEVGARGFMHDASSLYFTCKPRTRLVQVRVRLDASDTYTITVTAKSGDAMFGAPLYEASDIHAEALSGIVRTLAAKVTR